MVKNITLGPNEVQPHDPWIRQNVRSFKSCWKKKKRNRTNIPLIPRLVPRFSNTSRIEELTLEQHYTYGGMLMNIRIHAKSFQFLFQWYQK